jgi:hypothetical protein
LWFLFWALPASSVVRRTLPTPRRNRNRPHRLPAGLLSMPYALMKGGWLALAVQAALLPLFALSGQASRCLFCAPYQWLPPTAASC